MEITGTEAKAEPLAPEFRHLYPPVEGEPGPSSPGLDLLASAWDSIKSALGGLFSSSVSIPTPAPGQPPGTVAPPVSSPGIAPDFHPAEDWRKKAALYGGLALVALVLLRRRR